jgi:hypothetical protein
MGSSNNREKNEKSAQSTETSKLLCSQPKARRSVSTMVGRPALQCGDEESLHEDGAVLLAIPAMRVLIPPGYQRKMQDYFDIYGCMRCNREDAVTTDANQPQHGYVFSLK